MKKILITGGNSFIAKSIIGPLSNKYQVDCLTKESLDLTNLKQLQKILSSNYYDFVINTAISGQGRLLKEDSYEDFYKNCLMIENLLFCQDKYGKLVQFTSGAQWNRNEDINNVKEGDYKEPPQNRYSLAKFITNERIRNNNKIINLRIFNVFGRFEREDRFITSSIKKYINKEKIEIWGDTFFDFFGSNDLYLVLDYLLNNPPNKYFELNLCYEKKYKMNKIVSIINGLDKHKVEAIIKDGINKNYFGSSYKLANLGLKLNGLEEEIENLYRVLKQRQEQ